LTTLWRNSIGDADWRFELTLPFNAIKPKPTAYAMPFKPRGTIMRPTIDYLNARRDCKPASGGKVYSHRIEYAPDCDMDLTERTEAESNSRCAMLQIQVEAMWQSIFERFGVLPSGLDMVDEIPF
jgi:hypothetical protein